MELNRCLHRAVADRAREAIISHICLGLGYTGLLLDDGGIGVSYTYFDSKSGCSLIGDYQDFEGQSADRLLDHIESHNPLERSMALALINALNHGQVRNLLPDPKNDVLFDALEIGPGCRLAMVGLFKPLMGPLEARGATVAVIDEFRGMGDREEFYDRLANWADAALITSTAILNNTLETLLEHLGPKVKAALLGPSTPMIPQAFAQWPAIKALAGSVPLQAEAVIKTVRHALGTPYLHRYCNKVTITL